MSTPCQCHGTFGAILYQLECYTSENDTRAQLKSLTIQPAALKRIADRSNFGDRA